MGSSIKGMGWGELQRFGRPVPTRKQRHAVIKPQHVVNGRRAARRPRPPPRPQAKSSVLQLIIGSNAIGAGGRSPWS